MKIIQTITKVLTPREAASKAGGSFDAEEEEMDGTPDSEIPGSCDDVVAVSVRRFFARVFHILLKFPSKFSICLLDPLQARL